MQPDIPESAVRYGFITSPVGTHSGKTILFPELSLLMDAAPVVASLAEFRRLAVEENAVLKATVANRKSVFSTLTRVYSLRSDLQLFRAFRSLWNDAGAEQPLLSLLLAAARDSALRVSAPVILEKQIGDRAMTRDIEASLSSTYGSRYSPKTLHSMAEHLGGSWVQSGHLVGRTVKHRARATSGPASVTYALLLGYLCGVRGITLFETLWSRLLDLPIEELDAQAFAASQRGWLTYRRIGQVAEITFPPRFIGDD